MSGEPGDAEIGCAMTQQAKCAKCGGGVTLFLTAWSTDKPAQTQTWKCPHCHETNSAELPGKVGWVAARQTE